MGNPTGYNYHYPKPRAGYEEVVADSGLFHSTLKEFLSAMGTPLRHPPSVGDKAVDLHKLFLVVTEIGGADMIYGAEEWKAVAAAVLEPSFAENDNVHVELRKHYVSLLYHYERVYFCGADVFRMLPAGCDPVIQSISYP